MLLLQCSSFFEKGFILSHHLRRTPVRDLTASFPGTAKRIFDPTALLFGPVVPTIPGQLRLPMRPYHDGEVSNPPFPEMLIVMRLFKLPAIWVCIDCFHRFLKRSPNGFLLPLLELSIIAVIQIREGLGFLNHGTGIVRIKEIAPLKHGSRKLVNASRARAFCFCKLRSN